MFFVLAVALVNTSVCFSALMACSQGSGPQHIKIIAEWDPEAKNR